jgi:hypothetical protein
MKEKLQQLKLMVYKWLPVRWGLRSKVQQITQSSSELYEFRLSSIKPSHDIIHEIRQKILLNPYVVPTHPVHVKIMQTENELTELSISFTVFNSSQGEELEEQLRQLFPLTNPSTQ